MSVLVSRAVSLQNTFSADTIPLFASKRATSSSHTGDCIDSTPATRSPYETKDRASPDCVATSPFVVPLTLHRTRYQQWGVPDKLRVERQFICLLFSKKHARSVDGTPALVANYVAVDAALL
jgi:hypothetical protein